MKKSHFLSFFFSSFSMAQNYGYETLMTELPTYMKQVLRFSIKTVKAVFEGKLIDPLFASQLPSSLTRLISLRWSNEFLFIYYFDVISLERLSVSLAILVDVDLFKHHFVLCRLDVRVGEIYAHNYKENH